MFSKTQKISLFSQFKSDVIGKYWMKIPKVIFNIKPITSHVWWDGKNSNFDNFTVEYPFKLI